MQSEEPTIIQSLENHLAEYGHTTVGQDIAAAILVIKDLHQKAALSAAEQQPAPSVAVRALEWYELTSPREDGPAEPTGDWEASCGFGEYSVCLDQDEEMSETPWCAWSPENNEGHFSSVEEAKAAAQADYEARIRSALSAQVQDGAGWQSMDSAPKDGKHCLLAVKSGPFVYAVQGAYLMGEWGNAADIHSEPLCWMPLTRIPPVYLPWTDEFAAAAPAKQEG